MTWTVGVVDLVVPPRCPGCGRPPSGVWCATCARAADRLALTDLGCAALSDGVLAVGAFAYEGVVARTIRAIKVRGAFSAAAGLGDVLRTRLRLPAAAPDLAVTWVPSTRRRLRERGDDLPRLLAGPGATRLLERVLDRPDQTALDAAARRASPVGAFAPAAPAPRAVLLVDDVRTTGATAAAAATALQSAGARRVLVATLAVGGLQARAATVARSPAAARGTVSGPGSETQA